MKDKAMYILGFMSRRVRSPLGRREVILQSCNGETKIALVVESQAGFLARFYNTDSNWCVLARGGKILCGPSWITGWLPHSGWDGAENLPSKP